MPTNCSGVSRRDCLQLGLGTLLGGGLVAALRARGFAAEAVNKPAAKAKSLHPHLDGRRADALRDVRPQAGCARGVSRRVQGRSRPPCRACFFSEHMTKLAAASTSSR